MTEIEAVETSEVVDGGDERADRDNAVIKGQLREGVLES